MLRFKGDSPLVIPLVPASLLLCDPANHLAKGFIFGPTFSEARRVKDFFRQQLSPSIQPRRFDLTVSDCLSHSTSRFRHVPAIVKLALSRKTAKISEDTINTKCSIVQLQFAHPGCVQHDATIRHEI